MSGQILVFGVKGVSTTGIYVDHIIGMRPDIIISHAHRNSSLIW